ncbi:MAG TPA: hypothetical protein VEH30_07940 [Terriglobales bacterium]|nr:hypothetical protein [Terriglobales bacterium]
MKIRVAVTGEIKKGTCENPDCPLTKMYGPHEHEIEGSVMRIIPEEVRDKDIDLFLAKTKGIQ